ncbi:hypothetical protein PORY_001010 [Pneumocystis oryctolagi]|uniref:Uncharacterized protein n=1 Tax=Pneumocystis oryctolagi TaxID=42067 RepID=A0ACB7CCI6_9ASCO|nr:hypothetical protein PORY_001010 [Pneumocystis oryctolagi]
MQIDEQKPMKSIEHNIDEGLYSRQLYVLGHEAMKRMSVSNVLIIGLKGLGCEIAKNICLAGVKSVTLHDPHPIQIEDLSSQFFFKHSDIGKPRDQVSVPYLSELNHYVLVSFLKEELTHHVLDQFQIVILTETSLKKQLEINDYTHEHGICFISTDIRGLFGNIFCDFGKDFDVFDTNGESPISGIISSISQEGIVTILDETFHGLEDGDYVTFKEVKGMPALNISPPKKIQVKGPYTFSIGNVTNMGEYISGGIFTQVKMPKKLKFKSLRESILSPDFLISDYSKSERILSLHIAFQALHSYIEEFNSLPRSRNEIDAEKIYSIAKSISSKYSKELNLDEKVIKELAYQARGDLNPMAAIFGGLAAQEALKAISGKFTPIQQYMYFDSLESLTTSCTLTEESCAPVKSRYDGQIAVFGKDFQQKISNIKQFLVGTGAIGCEMLKNWAMMGLATGSKGKIFITDMDIIEKSNLNRQFLFKSEDVGKLKSECATAATIKMNPEMSGKIVTYRERVGPETENLFNADFFDSLDGVTNALDNVDTRIYVDQRCIFHRKPLLESGTLGTKGNTQVIYPYLTESYSSSRDPSEKSFPICTIKNFPNQIEHTIAWSRNLFEGYFKYPAENVNLYLSQPNFIQELLKQNENQKEILEIIHSYLVTSKPLTFEECIIWARLEFEKKFNNDIQQLLFNFPKDSVTSNGMPFWSGPKRTPVPLIFDINDEQHMTFIISGANLHAFNYGLKGETDKGIYKKVLENIIVPEFTPNTSIKINENDSELADMNVQTNTNELNYLINNLPHPSTLAGYRLNPVNFEKDDDTNYHIDFITAASNLRALNYGIEPTSRYNTKFIAGKIIPAIATTTALVSGLVCLELYKIIDGKNKLEDYRNSFLNLALPFIAFSEPIASPKLKYNNKEVSQIWERFDIYGDITLEELLLHFKNNENLTITMLSSGVSLLYASFFPEKKLQERRLMKITQLIELVSKKPISEHKKTILLEICADDEHGKDVEVPYICVHPGTSSKTAGQATVCKGCPNQEICLTAHPGPDPDIEWIKKRMETVRRKIFILSGKGGVGKSTFTAQLAWGLSINEKQIGVLDVDFCGPSIPLLMGCDGERIHTSGSGWTPVYVSDNICVMSIGFMLPSPEDAVIWRGNKKNGLIKQFLKDVEWSDLDYLLIDTPPGTSDEHLSTVNFLKESGIDGAVLITTPQETSLLDVRKEIDFCRKVGLPILGIVENMSVFVCPHCHYTSHIFKATTGGARALSEETNTTFLGTIPLDPQIRDACDRGLNFIEEYPDSLTSKAILSIINEICKKLSD